MTRWWLPLMLTLALGTAGCSQKQTDNASQDAQEAGRTAANTAEKATKEAGQVLDNAAVTSRVKTVLAALKGVDATKINVDTKDGVVTLSGTVPNALSKQTALATAQKVDGVKSVVDQLKVGNG